mgnify:FL=1
MVDEQAGTENDERDALPNNLRANRADDQADPVPDDAPPGPADEGQANDAERDMVEAEGLEEAAEHGNRDLKAEALTTRHMLLHAPKNPHCPVCQAAKMRHTPARRRTNVEKPKRFGHKVTMDHVYAKSDKMEGITGDVDLLVVYDLATAFVGVYPVKNKTSAAALEAIVQYAGTDKMKSVYSDCAPELTRAVKKAAGRRPIPHDHSIPGMPSTNAIAESQVGLAVRAVRTNLLQAGLPCCFWPYAAGHYAFTKNATLHEGDSAYNKRHRAGHIDRKKLIPFGALVQFKPSPVAKKQPKKMAPTTIPGILVGYLTNPGERWTDGYLCMPLDDFAGCSMHRDTPPTDFSVRVHKVREVFYDDTEPPKFHLKRT